MAHVNKLEGRSGALGTERCWAGLIQNHECLLCCCRYGELIPVRVGMVAGVGEYAWSSYRERVLGKGQAMLDIDPIYNSLASTDQERRRRYRAFLEEGVSLKEKQFIDESVNRNQLTGNHLFVDEIEQRIGLRVERRGRGRPRNEEK